VTTAEQGRRMEARLDALEVRLEEETEARERALAEEIARLDSRVAELSDALENLGVIARRTTADVGVTLEGLNEELRALRGRIDELRHQLDRTREENERFREHLDTRFAGLQGEEAVAEVQARQAARQAERPEEPGPFLEMATQRLEAGEHAVARNLLRDFQRRWPDHARADDAQFLVAETYFLQGDHRSAILEFNKVREGHPRSARMPRTLLRLGESFAALDLKREAGDFFDAVIRTYPDDPAAREAREKKRALGGR
jgi:tol-pal system protein YbgF